VLWGIVKLDELGRYNPGDYVCTSKISKFISDKSIITISGINYQSLTEISALSLPLSSISKLRAGYDPRLLALTKSKPS
jgi:hypothetical protein